MAKPNAFATRLVIAKSIVKEEERKAIVRRCLDTTYYAAAVALNEDFGFGSDRIARFLKAFTRVMSEYGILMHGADVDYADDKLEEAFKRIMER